MTSDTATRDSDLQARLPALAEGRVAIVTRAASGIVRGGQPRDGFAPPITDAGPSERLTGAPFV